MNDAQHKLFLSLWLLPFFAMQLAMGEFLIVRPPVKLVLIKGGRGL